MHSPLPIFHHHPNLSFVLQAAGQYYFSHPEVKDIVKRIKEDPRNYLRFAKTMIYYIKQ